MAKTNKFVHFPTRAAFINELTRTSVTDPSVAEGNDFYYYTVFIKDTCEIYTHGKFYGYKGIAVDLDNIDASALYNELNEKYIGAAIPGYIYGNGISYMVEVNFEKSTTKDAFLGIAKNLTLNSDDELIVTVLEVCADGSSSMFTQPVSEPNKNDIYYTVF